MKSIALVSVTTAILSFTFVHTAAAGKAADNRAPAPTVAVKTTPRVSPRVDVADQVKADMKGSKNFRKCTTRACLHSHQH